MESNIKIRSFRKGGISLLIDGLEDADIYSQLNKTLDQG